MARTFLNETADDPKAKLMRETLTDRPVQNVDFPSIQAVSVLSARRKGNTGMYIVHVYVVQQRSELKCEFAVCMILRSIYLFFSSPSLRGLTVIERAIDRRSYSTTLAEAQWRRNRFFISVARQREAN